MLFSIPFLTIICLLDMTYSNKMKFGQRSSRITFSSRSPRSQSLLMAGRTKALRTVKERTVGREDLGSDLEVDISPSSMSSLFEEADQEEQNPPTVGQIVSGTVIEIDDNGALLEIGGKMSGYLPVKEAALIPIKHVNQVLEVGSEITAEVIGTLKGMPVISLRNAQLVKAWEEIQKLRATDAVFETKVLEVNKGGAVCDVFGLKGFLPGSHFTTLPDQSIVGQTIKVKFLDLVEDEGKVVVSQRRASGAFELVRGAVVSGTVTGLRPYGAFLELENGVAGLLHISQISSDRVDNLEQLLSVGQKCKVMILEHDKVSGRVALSTKTLEANPGDMLRDSNAVFENALENAQKYHARVEADNAAREAVAKDVVSSLSGSLDARGADALASVADSIESILASIVSDVPSPAPAAEAGAA